MSEDADAIQIPLNAEPLYFNDFDGDELIFEAFSSTDDLVSTNIVDDVLNLEFYSNAFGIDTLFIVATDLSGESAIDTVLINVDSVNDAPVITNSTYFIVDEEETFFVNIDDFVFYDEIMK